MTLAVNWNIAEEHYPALGGVALSQRGNSRWQYEWDIYTIVSRRRGHLLLLTFASLSLSLSLAASIICDCGCGCGGDVMYACMQMPIGR